MARSAGPIRMFEARRALALAASLAASACSYVPTVSPYRIDIQQGNYVTQDMVSQLKRGMSREQVRFVLGTPLVTDIFHADRWDYVFYRDPRGGKREQRKLSVFFVDGKLARVEGDVLPASPQPGETPEAAAPANAAADKPAKPEADVPANAAADKPAKPKADVPAKSEAPAPGASPAGGPPASPAAEAPAGQNWSTASDAPASPPAQQDPKQDPQPQQNPPDAGGDKEERGFFGRMLEKIGL